MQQASSASNRERLNDEFLDARGGNKAFSEVETCLMPKALI